MTSLHLVWQILQAQRCAGMGRKILNIGSNDDPAQLKHHFPDEVINCDRYARDEGDAPHDNVVDVIFDAGRDDWPFDTNEVGLTIFGDILEHLEEPQIGHALQEAHRVGIFCAVTSPEDHRLTQGYRAQHERFAEGLAHTTLITEPFLRHQLLKAGFIPIEWNVISYGFVPRGHMALSVRAENWDPQQTPAV